jgi:hypothetical protein
VDPDSPASSATVLSPLIAASATFALNAALCLYRVRFMSCSRAPRAFQGQGSTLATCLIFGVQLILHTLLRYLADWDRGNCSGSFYSARLSGISVHGISGISAYRFSSTVGEAALSAGAAVLFSCTNRSFHAKVNFGAKPVVGGIELDDLDWLNVVLPLKEKQLDGRGIPGED